MSTDTIIEGLMLLGRTKEEAIQELIKHQRLQADELTKELYELYDNWAKSRRR